MVDPSTVLLWLVRLLIEETEADKPQDRLCRAAVRLLRARGGALSVATVDKRIVVAATSTTARRLEELQDLLGEGPSVDAVEQRRQRDTVTSGVFPAHLVFETAAYGLLGDVRVLSFPVPVDGEAAVGSLTVYDAPPPWSDERLEIGGLTAALLGVMLLQKETFERVLRSAPWQQRLLVHEATGVVMARLHLPAAESLSLLRAHAFTSAADLSTAARQVVEEEDTAWMSQSGDA